MMSPAMSHPEITVKQVLTDSNLLQAWYKVRANQGCAGIDRESLSDFESGLMSSLALLRDEVIYDTYRPRPLFRIHVPKKNSPGTRPLSIPTVRDRVLQTAVTRVLTPLFEAEFEECSFAYRPGRSVNMALQRVEQLRDQGFVWVVDADISSFFDEIDHQVLLREVKKLVEDQAILHLIECWLVAVVVDGPQRFRLHKGVPQGSPLSPLLANLYLDQLDEAVLDENLRLIRFADDFLILCRKKERAEQALQFTAEVLESLRLKLHKKKTRVVDFKQGFRFLGVEFVRSLAIKAKYPAAQASFLDTEHLGIIPDEYAADIEPEPGEEEAAIVDRDESDTGTDQARIIRFQYPKTEMALAFAEAGIRPSYFSSRIEQKDPTGAEDEPEQVMPVEPPVAAAGVSTPVDLDPRLRTLYVLENGYVLGKESERFTIRRRGEVLQRIPAIKVDQIMIFGNAQITTQAMHFCLQAKIPIYLLSGQGRFHGVVDGFSTDPVLLHRDQFRRAEEPEFCLAISKACIRAKIGNCRTVLRRYARKQEPGSLSQAADRLKIILKELSNADSLNAIRGHEGAAARIYFSALSKAVDPDWCFSGRTRQPPKDPVNALLSYGYTLLFYNIYSFLRSRGLNPQVGFLHQVRVGHPALASDMIEEFRAIIVDAVVLNLVFNRRLTPDQFIMPDGTGKGCILEEAPRKLFIKELEKKMNSSITHPVSGLRLDYRRCLEHQVHHLASVIQGREPLYKPMVIR